MIFRKEKGTEGTLGGTQMVGGIQTEAVTEGIRTEAVMEEEGTPKEVEGMVMMGGTPTEEVTKVGGTPMAEVTEVGGILEEVVTPVDFKAGCYNISCSFTKPNQISTFHPLMQNNVKYQFLLFLISMYIYIVQRFCTYTMFLYIYNVRVHIQCACIFTVSAYIYNVLFNAQCTKYSYIYNVLV